MNKERIRKRRVGKRKEKGRREGTNDAVAISMESSPPSVSRGPDDTGSGSWLL